MRPKRKKISKLSLVLEVLLLIAIPFVLLMFFNVTRDELPEYKGYAYESGNSPKYRIKVAIFNVEDVKMLAKQWNSLINAEYPPLIADIRLDVEIVVDCTDDTFQDVKNQAKMSDYLQTLNWEYGELYISRKIRPTYFRKSLLRSWYPLKDKEFLLVLEPGTMLSKYWYSYLVATLDKTLSLSATADERVNIIGISLLSPEISFKTLDRISDGVVKNRMYGGRLVTTVGVCFFPSFWHEFQEWYVVDGRNSTLSSYFPSIAEHEQSKGLWNSFTALYQIYSLSFSESQSNVILYPPLSFATKEFGYLVSRDLVSTGRQWKRIRKTIDKMSFRDMDVLDMEGKIEIL